MIILLLSILEGLGYKFMCIVIYQRLVPILDDFVAMFLNLTNMIVGGFLAIIALNTENFLRIEMRAVGLPNSFASSTPLKFE